MEEPFFRNAPANVSFFGGDPVALSEVQAIELGVWGDKGLADRLDDALRLGKRSILGFPIQKEGLKLGNGECAS